MAIGNRVQDPWIRYGQRDNPSFANTNCIFSINKFEERFLTVQICLTPNTSPEELFLDFESREERDACYQTFQPVPGRFRTEARLWIEEDRTGVLINASLFEFADLNETNNTIQFSNFASTNGRIDYLFTAQFSPNGGGST